MILPAIAFIAATYVANVQVPVDRMFTGPLPLVKSQRNAPKQTVAIKPPRSKSPYYKKGHHRTKKIYHAFATKSRQIDRFAMPAMRSAGKIAIRNLAVQAELRANAVVPITSATALALLTPAVSADHNETPLNVALLGVGTPNAGERGIQLSTPQIGVGAPVALSGLIRTLPVSDTPLPSEFKKVNPSALTPDPTPPAPSSAPRIEPKGSASTATLLDPICSISVSQEEPGKILQILSEQTHANLMLLTKPDVKLTVRLSKVPLTAMIRHICAMSDLEFLKIGETYVIASGEKLKLAYAEEWNAAHPAKSVPIVEELPRSTECYRTNFVNASQIADALGKLIPDKLLTVVSGPQSLSPDLGSQNGSQSTGTATNVLAKTVQDHDKANTRTLIISGPATLVKQAMVIVKQLDQPRTQVSIAVKVNDISNDALKDMGLSWSFGNLNISEVKSGGLHFGKFDRSPQTFSATLQALENANKAKLLAAPSISVLDGERAFVLIGNRVNYPVLVGYSQNNAPIFSKEEERVGIYLQVAVSVSSDDTITLSLYPQVSSITGYLNVNGASYPQISTREAQSTLRLKSGESLVMGGLFKDESIDQMEKVPLLGDIPFLKELFRHRKTTKTASQVIITVTPTIIKPIL